MASPPAPISALTKTDRGASPACGGMGETQTPGTCVGVRLPHLFAIALLFLVCECIEVRHVRTLRGDETYYINAAQTMIESGDWLTPRYESGRLRFQKPILTYWLVAGSMRLFGLGLAAARMPSVILALATFPFVYGLARLLLRSQFAARLSVVVHASATSVFANAFQARTDTTLAFFVIAAMYFFARILFEPTHGRRDAILAYAATAGAILTKGLAGFGFILLPVAVFLVIAWRQVGRSRWRAAASPWGVAVMALLIAPWFIPVLLRHGGAFVDMFLGDQIGTRITGEQTHLLHNILDYLWLLVRGTLPWCILLILGLLTNDAHLWSALRERKTEWKFLLTWFVVMLLIFLSANITRGRYLLPLMPVFSLLAGLFLARVIERAAAVRGVTWGFYAFAAAILLTGVACMAQAIALRVFDVPVGVLRPIVAGVLIIGGLAMFRLVRRCFLSSATLCGATLMLLCSLVFDLYFLAPEPTETAADLGRDVLALQPQDVPMAAVGLKKHTRAAASLYSRRRFAEWTESRDPSEQAKFLERFLSTPGRKLVVLDDSAYEALRPELSQKLRLLDSRSTFKSIFEAWLFERPKDLRAWIHENKFTLYLLSPEPHAPVAVPQDLPR